MPEIDNTRIDHSHSSFSVLRDCSTETANIALELAISKLNDAIDVTTAGLNNALQETDDIHRFLKTSRFFMLNQSLYDHLNQLLTQKNLCVMDVVRASQLNKAYVYQIFDGKKNPSRDTLIAIAFGLKLSDAETDQMLKIARYKELYVRDERDAIIKFCIQHSMDILKTNELLVQYDFNALGSF